ncbi:MAG: hypothetical protein U9R66_08755 [Thermodesulfobacteriota bacterium]|nr:hypothetical protein [Thermodesulfobacteriota bacterium]
MRWIAIILTLIAATSPALADPLPSIEKVLSEGSRWTLDIAGEKGILELLSGKTRHGPGEKMRVDMKVRWQGQPGKLKASADRDNRQLRIMLSVESSRDRTRFNCKGEVSPDDPRRMSGKCRWGKRSGPWHAAREDHAVSHPPVLTLDLQPDHPMPGEKITLRAQATDPSGIDRIVILVDRREVKTCHASSCTWSGGPYAAGVLTYGANAYDRAGNRAWSGYQTVEIVRRASEGERREFKTMHEGLVPYVHHSGNWYRVHGEVKRSAGDWNFFFPHYRANTPAVQRLLRDAGDTGRPARTDEEVWERIRSVWNFLGRFARSGVVPHAADHWPSIIEHADYYAAHTDLLWAACMSKSLLFATLAGRMIDSPNRIAVASCRHIASDGRPTATHVYLAVLLGGRWLYLDPAMAASAGLPLYDRRRSVGMPGVSDIDYLHPYKILSLPGSRLSRVPYLGD